MNTTRQTKCHNFPLNIRLRRRCNIPSSQLGLLMRTFLTAELQLRLTNLKYFNKRLVNIFDNIHSESTALRR